MNVEATYKVPAVTATGESKVAYCQPAATTAGKVTVAKRVPSGPNNDPVWTPVLA